MTKCEEKVKQGSDYTPVSTLITIHQKRRNREGARLQRSRAALHSLQYNAHTDVII
jgi:cobalamin biosynthesis Co2+ chelatase CbiK